MQKINIYGLGYIGLPTASLLANKGYDVLGIDVSEKVIETINKGDVHIIEPDLESLVKSAVMSKKLRASLTAQAADIHIITVPTPFTTEYKADLSYVEAATQTVCQVLKAGDLVILESTSPVGTTEMIQQHIAKQLPELSTVYIAHSPERVIPGHVLRELIENDRVVGGVDAVSTEKAVAFYQTFVTGEVIPTDAKTAEMCKLTENSFRDVNIAFANELSLICDHLNINVWELIKLANHHPRVNILQPGPGVGGHCIAVDPWFIVDSAPDQAKLIRQARQVNDSKPEWVIEQVKLKAKKFKNPVIACLGATFKANIDDLRESPALKIIRRLQLEKIGQIITVEPNVTEIENIHLVTLEDALQNADIILTLVDHTAFKKIAVEHLLDKTIIDTKGIFAL